MHEIIVVIDILSALGLIGLVLLQQGKGADMGAAFGSGASQTLFGSRGTANFLTRTTAILAVIFFAANLALAYLATTPKESGSVATKVAPAAPSPAPAAAGAPAAPEQKVPEVPK
jgi:preprotein translocase subunit SecG